ncbi:MAG: hypothetical protein NTY69_12160 [Methylococcales bacterium]|nr:hypothetical protein [Methylococcales bacterium]
MFHINNQEITPEFAEMYQAAGLYLDKQVQDGIKFWLKASLTPPFLEHLSFRLGNQLFFIRLEDVAGKVNPPANINGLCAIADACEGHACLLPMEKKFFGGWQPLKGGWGLIDARTGNAIDPIALITDEKIIMTDWEVQDFSVQIVRDDLIRNGYQLMSWQGSPLVNPSIWFIGDSGGPEWVVVRFSRNSKKAPLSKPDNWDEIAQSASSLSHIGHFAPVYPANANDAFDPIIGSITPLYRGYQLLVSYKGLETPKFE